MSVTISDKPVVSITGNYSTCLNTEETYSTSSGANITNKWTAVNGSVVGPSNTSTFKVLWDKVGSGSVKLVQTNTQTNFKDSLTKSVTINNLPNVTLTLQSEICINDGSITLTGGSPTGGTYSGDGVAGNIFNPAAAGVGTHTITYSYSNSNGCKSEASKIITVQAKPDKPTITENSGELISSSLLGNQWFKDGVEISGANLNKYTPTVSGLYQVQVTQNGCTSDMSDGKQITIDPSKLIADFSVDKTSGEAPLSVQFTNKSSTRAKTWLYEFGDSTTSTEQSPNHTYNNAGTYTVTLTVTDGGLNDKIVKTNLITVSTTKPLTADFISDIQVGEVPLTVQFSDKSSGKPTTWNWNFGDGGTSNEQNPSHTYNQTGYFTVTLYVSNGNEIKNTTKSNYIQVIDKIPLVADFTANIIEGEAPEEITFTDLSVGEATAWFWEFGDGSTSTLRNPKHIYTDAGVYTVKLTISDGKTFNEKEKVNYITITNLLPLNADFYAEPLSGEVPLTVQFINTSKGKPTIWSWEFGDGEKSNERNPQHTYQTVGKYSVKLLVSNGSDIKSTEKQAYIEVKEQTAKSQITLYIDNFSANTGETVMMPIKAKDIQNIPESVTKFSLKLRFNGTILYPDGSTPKGTMEGLDRVVTLDLPTKPDKDGVLTKFEMLAMLGNSESTPIILESATAEGGVVQIYKEGSPVFTLNNVSKEGGTRLITSRQKGIVTVKIDPNPSNELATLSIESKIETKVDISIANLYGMEVLTISNKSLSIGNNELKLSLKKITSGTYFITVKSENYNKTIMFNIVK